VGAARTWGDRASQALLGASLHAFPLLSRIDRHGMVGKLVALRRASLEAVGGFASLARVLGEDMELGCRLAGRGEKVVVAGATARSLAAGRSLGAVVARYARWVAVVRGQRPLLLPSYPLLFASAPIVAALALGAGAPAIAGAALGLRVALARAAQAACGRRGSLPSALAEALLADTLLLAAFVRAVGSREVEWRGERLRVLRGGILVGARPRRLSGRPVGSARASW
jgi:ceramide glucosyltransferase